MYSVSLINPNFQTGPEHLNSFYIPYTIGTLWGYAVQDERIKDRQESKPSYFELSISDDNSHQPSAYATALLS